MPDMDPNANVINATASAAEYQATVLAHLSSIENALKNLVSGQATSQSAARDMNNTGAQKDSFARQYDEFFKNRKKPGSKFSSHKGFIDGLEEGLLEGLLGSDFKKDIQKVLKSFSDQIGVDLRDLSNQLGKQLAKQGTDAFKGTELGKQIFSKLSSYKDKATKFATDKAAPKIKSFLEGKINVFDEFGKFAAKDKSGYGKFAKAAGSGLGKVFEGAGSKVGGKFGKILTGTGHIFSQGASTIGASGAAAGGAAAGGAAAGGAASGLAALGPYALVAAAAIVALTAVVKSLGPAIEGTKKLFNEMKKAGDRYKNSRKENLKLEQQRLREDVETIITYPFKILERAAQKAYDAWDQNLRIISATQGYGKADVQNLMAAYAERIRSEGLSDVINSADITENLSKVLQAGLSGPVAEEFAYIATKLNAAVPTQDFFAYASQYAALVANAQQMGMSQVEAVQQANAAIETYASNILYASRQLTGGVTTGLQNAQRIFQDALRITQASRTGNISQISGTLASVSAVIGAIAPDLAPSLIDLVADAATGGNADQLVALRSLAGVNASNTEFLRQLATNPKSLFVSLFENLGRMQKMSDGAYMEVAEGLSSIFGVSLEALARIDFNYLAQSISQMSVGTAALEENMELLASGQTTLTAEQLKNAQINKYMIDEGLSYVLDNEAARAIQQHMWDEQMKRELMEATYSVELKGAALEFLEGIKQTVNNIVNILNPFAWIGKLVNIAATATEANGHEADIASVLQLGKVGSGTSVSALQQLYNLTTRGRDLNLTPHLVDLLGGHSAYESAHLGTQLWNSIFNNPVATAMDSQQDIWELLTGPATYATLASMLTTVGTGTGSRYAWKDLRKSTSTALTTVLSGGSPMSFENVSTSDTAAQSGAAERLKKMLDTEYIDSFVKSGKGYTEWAATATKFGIRDISKAIEDAGYTQSQIEAFFEQQQTIQGKEEKKQEALDQQDFRDKGRQFWIDQIARMDTTIENMSVTNSLLTSILEGQTDFFTGRFAAWNKSWDAFYTRWVNYFVEHQYYNERTGLDYAKIREQEHSESNGAIYALAEAFNNGVADISDPAVQTNALLSKILLVLSSIMQQNAARGGTALTDTLNALAMGLTTNP